MKQEYDFSRGTRGPVLKVPPGKTRITIRLDDDVLDFFRAQVHEAGGGNYQSLMNAALRAFIAERTQSLEGTLRQVLREELGQYVVKRAPAKRLRTRSKDKAARKS
jgi:hypothetical protein